MVNVTNTYILETGIPKVLICLGEILSAIILVSISNIFIALTKFHKNTSSLKIYRKAFG